MNLAHLLFSSDGRINRAKWWLIFLIYIFIGKVVVVVVSGFADEPTPAPVLSIIVLIGAILLSLPVTIKRLHDRNKSGAWLNIFYLLPWALGGLAGVAMIYGSDAGNLLMVRIGEIIPFISSAIFIWSLVELGCLRGTVGVNRFGPDPLEGKL
jgi:uncharacterized membrane protein YhaH (DUF805 family)